VTVGVTVGVTDGVTVGDGLIVGDGVGLGVGEGLGATVTVLIVSVTAASLETEGVPTFFEVGMRVYQGASGRGP
jgi:hypothetical protein